MKEENWESLHQKHPKKETRGGQGKEPHQFKEREKSVKEISGEKKGKKMPNFRGDDPEGRRLNEVKLTGHITYGVFKGNFT